MNEVEVRELLTDALLALGSVDGNEALEVRRRIRAFLAKIPENPRYRPTNKRVRAPGQSTKKQRGTSVKIARTPGRLSNEQLRALLEEGMELGQAFANKVSSMRVITPEDLKTRIK